MPALPRIAVRGVYSQVAASRGKVTVPVSAVQLSRRGHRRRKEEKEVPSTSPSGDDQTVLQVGNQPELTWSEPRKEKGTSQRCPSFVFRFCPSLSLGG